MDTLKRGLFPYAEYGVGDILLALMMGGLLLYSATHTEQNPSDCLDASPLAQITGCGEVDDSLLDTNLSSLPSR